jgi:hypothetical protein
MRVSVVARGKVLSLDHMPWVATLLRRGGIVAKWF